MTKMKRPKSGTIWRSTNTNNYYIVVPHSQNYITPRHLKNKTTVSLKDIDGDSYTVGYDDLYSFHDGTYKLLSKLEALLLCR